jgi:hypothetical protein
MASPAVAFPRQESPTAVASPTRGSPTAVAAPSRGSTTADTTAPSPFSPLRRLASVSPADDAPAGSSPASAHSGDQLSASDAAVGSACVRIRPLTLSRLVYDVPRLLSVVQGPLLASRSEEYRLLFRLPPDEVKFHALAAGDRVIPSLLLCDLDVHFWGRDSSVLGEFECSKCLYWGQLD